MRRTVILLELVCACALLSACGKGSYTTAASTTPNASAHGAGAAHGPGTTHGAAPSGGEPTRAQALAFARAVNLTAADVPGFTPSAKPEHESPTERRLQQQLRGCGVGAAGGSAMQHTQPTLVEASSPDFELHRGVLALSVSSEVSVSHTPAEAAAVLSAIRDPRVRACFAHYLSSLLKSERHPGASVVGVSIASGTPPAPGTTGGFGWRVTATFAIRGIHISLYFDILGFVYGPSQVTLESSGTVRPFPAAAQEQLYEQLLTRARSHSLQAIRSTSLGEMHSAFAFRPRLGAFSASGCGGGAAGRRMRLPGAGSHATLLRGRTCAASPSGACAAR